MKHAETYGNYGRYFTCFDRLQLINNGNQLGLFNITCT